jgi:hypothetical protein
MTSSTTTSADAVRTGGCYCGRVRYEATGPVISTNYCHCTQCRRTSGAPFLTFLTIPRSGFRLLAGEPKRFRSSQKVQRGFCDECGATLTLEEDELPDEISVTSASLDDPDTAAPQYHIFTSTQIAWIDLNDTATRYPNSRLEGRSS